MPFQFEIDANHAHAALEGAPKAVMDRFAELLRPIEQAVTSDARSRALAHFHSTGKKPGLYLSGFHGGVSRKSETRVVGWVRNENQLAHLFEYGFTIRDLLIEANGVMAFEVAGVGELYRRAVHRHATKVQAYPALRPAFVAHAGQVRAAADQAAAL